MQIAKMKTFAKEPLKLSYFNHDISVTLTETLVFASIHQVLVYTCLINNSSRNMADLTE